MTDVSGYVLLVSVTVSVATRTGPVFGATENVIFPEYFGIEVRLTNKDDGLRLDPAVIQSSEFSVAALRHPAIKGSSGQQIKVRIG